MYVLGGGRYCVWGRSFSHTPPPVDKTLLAVVVSVASSYNSSD